MGKERNVTGVSVFFAVFIGLAFALATWDRFQADGWDGVRPMIAALLAGAMLGAFVEVLHGALESRSAPAFKALKWSLAIAGLALSLIWLAGAWDSGGDVALAVMSGAGLARLSVAGWQRVRRTRVSPPTMESEWR